MTEDSGQNTVNHKEPLRVLFVTHNYIRHEGDFAGVFLHLLAKKLKEQGVEVHVVAPHDAGVSEYEEIDGIKIHRFRYADDQKETLAYRGDMHRQLLRNPFKIFRLIRFIKSAGRLSSTVIEKEDISVVSIHWLVPNGLVGRFLKRKYGDRIRLFLSSHGTDVRILTGVPFLYRYLKSTVRMAEGWTVVSRYLRDLILKHDKSAAGMIKVVPLPNDETIFYPDGSIDKDANLVVAVSRLTIQKRLDYLLEAVRIISGDRPDIRLEIYGKGSEKEKLERRISELGLEGKAVICEPVPQKGLRKVYNRATVVVLNSIEEGFGLVLTEAMLCRTAVIGANSGGIKDIIDDGETGLLVPPDNAQELAGEIKRLLDDVSLRERLTEAGYQKAIENFSSKSSAEKFVELFRR